MFLLLSLFTVVASIPSQLRGSCNFETDTCGYTSDPEFTSWTYNRDGTDLKDGHFITVEGSAGEEEWEEGGRGGQDGGVRKAVLLSPVLDLEEWVCLRLVFQISGSGSLQVQQRQEGRSFDRPIWSSQTPTDNWILASIDLQNTTEPYRVIIEGRPGESATSSVAVFEISLSTGYCLDCDFEESHLCGYSNQWNSNVNWYVGGAVTNDPESSLPDDHTHGNGTGHYMYVDSIYARTFQEVAKMASPMTTVPLSGCLSFQYQRGEEKGNLFSLYTRDQAGQYQELWRADPEREDQSDWAATTWEWIPVQVDLKAPYPLQVVFEVGFSGPRGGHVALDDISFSPEFCSPETEPTFDPSIADCDFELGLCRYVQDQSATSPWKRVSVRPNIYRTGDHSTGSGSFLLAHSRMGPRTGYVSQLVGPILPGNMKYCLRFFYSLRGFNQTEQALAVYLQDQGGATLDKIWAQGTKSRRIWIATDVTFQSSQPAKVMFVSTCKSFWDCGSVALDDITVRLGDCDITEGQILSVPGHCNFETDQCGYTQDKVSDTGDWVHTKGPTPTSYTGPRGDHTTGRGHYMHIEASSLLSGQNARLLSSILRGSRGPQCLRFFYHMYGSGTGQLSVYLNRDGQDVLLWQRNGEQSITWQRAAVEYQSDGQHQIVFDASRGSSVRSDIAIDDIMFDSGPCPESEIHTASIPDNSNDIE